MTGTRAPVFGTLIFDLSEVLIAGLLGIEEPLSERLGISPRQVLDALGIDQFHELLCGRISEVIYLDYVIAHGGWDMAAEELKGVIRRNFHRRVPGMDEIISRLADRCELVLLSDHAAEWVDYIEAIHPFLHIFEPRFFSCYLGQTKSEPFTFRRVLDHLGCAPEECLFIDDSPRNVQAAASVGIPGVRFVSTEGLRQELVDRGLF